MIVILTAEGKLFFVINAYDNEIDSISYEENVLQNNNGYRTNGLGNLKYAMGNFKNDIFGDYIRYTHASCHSYVVMNIDGKILVVNV